MSTYKQEEKLVHKLALVQLYKLEKARWKGHWGNEGRRFLLRAARKKLSRIDGLCRTNPMVAWEYAADAANFMAMACENAGKNEK